MTDGQSWVESANEPGCDFPLANLPYGVFAQEEGDRIGVAIGNLVLDLHACGSSGLLDALSPALRRSCEAPALNGLMSLGAEAARSLRRRITQLLSDTSEREFVERMLVPMREVTMKLPAAVGDYTDFYASIQHATHVGRLFRPDDPLVPAYRHLPIGYHGRASSLVVSGTPVQRPSGQRKPLTASVPEFGPSRALDYELEIGCFVGEGNALGVPIALEEAERHLFGFCLLNDWSARDIQAWEYQPLGPFLGKSFATSVSPWVVPLEALAPYRVAAARRAEGDPELLPYLTSTRDAEAGAFDLTLEVRIVSSRMRDERLVPYVLSRGTLRDLYWTPAQMIAHHSSNGCNLRAGDLLGTGTISGESESTLGCLLERTRMGAAPITLPSGETRTYLEDGDEIILRAFAEREGLPRIGFGTCSGRVAAALNGLS